MATSIILIRRYVWLVDTIRRVGKDINRKSASNTSLNIVANSKATYKLCFMLQR